MAARKKAPLRCYVAKAEDADIVTGEITARVGGKQVGRLTFEDYPTMKGGRQVRITMVQVDEAQRRRGVATAMVAKLRKTVPASTLAPPALNDAGRGLMNAIFDRFAEPLKV